MFDYSTSQGIRDAFQEFKEQGMEVLWGCTPDLIQKRWDEILGYLDIADEDDAPAWLSKAGHVFDCLEELMGTFDWLQARVDAMRVSSWLGIIIALWTLQGIQKAEQ